MTRRLPSFARRFIPPFAAWILAWSAPLAPVPGFAPAATLAAADRTPTRATVRPAPHRPAPAQVAQAAPAPAAASAASPPSAAAAPGFAERPEVRDFVRQMVDRHAFDEAALLSLLSRARGSDRVVRLMSPPPPGTRRSWPAYRDRFVEPVRIREGLRFWREHADTVRRAAREYGVPEEILVSIIGVETIYGRQTGDFRVLDSLATLAFDYPRRAAYFREELEQFLLLSREHATDPLAWRGSFAGAIGLPQFMPGSIRRHAVDFDGDGRIDLRGSPADAIGSVARFLADHGWQPGGATHYPVRVDDEIRARIVVETGIPPQLTAPRLTAAGLPEYGLSSPREIPEDEKVSLIDLPAGESGLQYALVSANFFAITHYNRSYFYAMAVIELAQALQDAARPTTQARTAP